MPNQWLTHSVQITDHESEDHLNQQWLLTNGLGSYAMGTVAAVNSQRYHGLFVAASQPPIGRVVALNQMLERFKHHHQLGTQVIEFSTCRFPDQQGQAIYTPQGHHMLRRFDRGLNMTWVYQFKHIQFIRELNLHWKEQAATVRYLIAGLPAHEKATLCLHPMMTLRDFHHLHKKNDEPTFQVQANAQSCNIQRGDLSVNLNCPASQFYPSENCWYNIYYPFDAERGQDCQEDYFLPGFFEVTVPGGRVTDIRFTVSLGDTPLMPHWENKKRSSHLQPQVQAIAKSIPKKITSFSKTLAMAANDFIVQRTVSGEKLSTIIAGYPWFADWGRDTFIALPGLLLCTGRFAEARDTLHAFAKAIRRGLVPNRFDDYNQNTQAAHFNTVDASLWFVQAAMSYMQATNDIDAGKAWLYQAVQQIIDQYIVGTDFDIHMTKDGLITAGSNETQLTWMDAKCNDVIFTPRQGKAVEINALWYNALVGASELLSKHDKKTAIRYRKTSAQTKRSFDKVFWDDHYEYLRDHLWTSSDGYEHADRTCRPNQIFAASLPYSPLSTTKQKKVVQAVGQALLTPFGLRTLPVSDPNYHPNYTGNGFDRDEAYHQGTIWPWLIGPYAEAVLRTGKFNKKAKAKAIAIVKPLTDQMKGEGFGQLHEIHEAKEPRRPVGCMAQAWSVAEVLRVLCLIGP